MAVVVCLLWWIIVAAQQCSHQIIRLFNIWMYHLENVFNSIYSYAVSSQYFNVVLQWTYKNYVRSVNKQITSCTILWSCRLWNFLAIPTQLNPILCFLFFYYSVCTKKLLHERGHFRAITGNPDIISMDVLYHSSTKCQNSETENICQKISWGKKWKKRLMLRLLFKFAIGFSK